MIKEISIFKEYLTPKGPQYKGGKSRDEIVSDKPIYKLSSNENMLGSSPLAMEAVQKHLGGLNEYPDNNDLRFRKALSEFYGGELSPDQFITDNSGVGILQLITSTILGEGLECIFSNPGFVPYRAFPEKMGAKTIDVPLKGDNWELDVDGIISKITDKTRLIWTCSPNNPTGSHIPKHKMDELIARVPDHVVVVYDEVYYQYATASDFVRGTEYVHQGKKVIAVNSFSKAYGLAGLRVGYAYSTKEIARYVSQWRRPFFINTLSMEAAMAALKDTEFINRTVDLVNKGKAYLYPELDKIGIKYWKSQANFILLKPEMEEAEFEAKMHTQGIMTRPVAAFGAPGHIRVTIGTQEANEAFIAGLKAVV